jgi:hypothetical protein
MSAVSDHISVVNTEMQMSMYVQIPRVDRPQRFVCEHHALPEHVQDQAIARHVPAGISIARQRFLVVIAADEDLRAIQAPADRLPAGVTCGRERNVPDMDERV